MTTIYFDTHLGDEERRRRLYAGDIFVFSPRPSTKALTEFARGLIEEAFHPLDPQHAQDSLPVEEFVEIMGPLKPRFIHPPRTLELLLELLRDVANGRVPSPWLAGGRVDGDRWILPAIQARVLSSVFDRTQHSVRCMPCLSKSGISMRT